MKNDKLNFILMNKNTPVLELKFCFKRGGYIEDIIKLHNPEYAPLGLVNKDKSINPDELSDWWEERCLPDSRINVEHLFEALNLNKQELIIHSLGLSLSDQYWLKPVGSDIKWNDVNFFTNDFSDKVGKLFFFTSFSDNAESILEEYSPDYSSNGFLNKYWTIINNGRFLVKGNHGAFSQQSYNEVIASRILQSIFCKNYVKYDLLGQNSICKNFVSDTTEYVPASLIRRILPKKDNETYYNHFLRCCKYFGFHKEMQSALDYIIPFDYLIANEDRNYGNFGIIRNVETLKIESIAPIFDNGNSLWYNQVEISNKNVKSYPFELEQNRQIKLVQDKSIFPIDEISKIEYIIKDVLKQNRNCDKNRISNICLAVQRRIAILKQILSNEKQKNLQR
ncbi:MAG: hypothetical protein IKN12_02315 [Selenomonadaceae bacterium]|nr:hypothetical protein [Selenomonadaceae bacterium]